MLPGVLHGLRTGQPAIAVTAAGSAAARTAGVGMVIARLRGAVHGDCAPENTSTAIACPDCEKAITATETTGMPKARPAIVRPCSLTYLIRPSLSPLVFACLQEPLKQRLLLLLQRGLVDLARLVL